MVLKDMEFTDDELRALVRTYERMPDRIQGFLYGDNHVIRDVWLRENQTLWRRPVKECSEAEFLEQVAVERMRLAVKQASLEASLSRD